MLSVAVRLLSPTFDEIHIYKATHINHPISVWVRSNAQNYTWTLAMADALAQEWKYRYDKSHRSHEIVNYIKSLELDKILPSSTSGIITTIPCCMPKEYIIEDENGLNPIESYRNYYMTAKRHLASWKRRTAPKWWK